MQESQETSKTYKYLPYVNKLLTYVDDAILIVVGFGIIVVAGLLMLEAVSDFIFYTQHSISHIISDLMFVLIVMELFRQVMRQLNRQTFTLNPFIYIGVIASIRGLLLTQMKIGMGEEDWQGGVVKLGVQAGIVLILVICLYLYSRARPEDSAMGRK